jgi:hypothetical protein
MVVELISNLLYSSRPTGSGLAPLSIPSWFGNMRLLQSDDDLAFNTPDRKVILITKTAGGRLSL